MATKPFDLGRELPELNSSNLTRRELAIERARQAQLSDDQLRSIRTTALSSTAPELQRLSCVAIL